MPFALSARPPLPLSISHCVSAQPETRLVRQTSPLPCRVLCLCRKHPLEEPFLLPPKNTAENTAQEKQALAVKALSREGVEHHLVKVSKETISCKPREELLLLGTLRNSRLVLCPPRLLTVFAWGKLVPAAERVELRRERAQFLVTFLFIPFCCPSRSEQGSRDLLRRQATWFCSPFKHGPLWLCCS